MNKNRYTVALMVLISSTAYAGDNMMDELNTVYVPTVEGQRGYEIEFREDNSHGWVNIVLVERTCSVLTTITLEGGSLQTKVGKQCYNRGFLKESLLPLHQVSCKPSGHLAQCKKQVRTQLTKTVIDQIIKQQISDVELPIK